MRLKELCMKLGVRLSIDINYGLLRPDMPPEMCVPLMGTHTCRLDPKRCTIVVDGEEVESGYPYGKGFSEQEAMIDLVSGLLLCMEPNHRTKRTNKVVIRYRCADNTVREFPIPADLTA
jgi:hypothetical protein